MSMFTRCSTAVALVLASSIPSFAQDFDAATLALPEGFVAPEGSVVLQFAGTEALYIVPDSVAAELCRVTDGEFAAVVESGVDVIYCEQLDETTFATFTETDGVETLVDRQDGGDDAVDLEGDDAGEAAEGDDSSDGGAVGEDDGAGDSPDGSADGDDVAGGDGAEEGETGTNGGNVGDVDGSADVDVDAEADVEAGADAEAGSDSGN